MRIGVILIMFLASTLPCTTLAISNIETERIEPSELGWSGFFQIGIEGKNGNQKEKSRSVSGKLIRRTDTTTLMGVLRSDYGETVDIKNTDEEFVHLRWTRRFSDIVALESFVQWETNEFDLLVSRSLLGAGGRYTLSDNPASYLFNFGVGAFREREKQDFGPANETNWVWRANAYCNYVRNLNPYTNISGTLYLQPNIEDSSDYRALLNAKLSIELSGSIEIQLIYNVAHDSEPVQNFAVTPIIDKKSTNTDYQSAIVFKF